MNASDQKTSSEAAVNYRECVYPVPHVPLKINDAKPIDGGIKQLLKRIRPEWPTEHVQFKVTLLLLINSSSFLVGTVCTTARDVRCKKNKVSIQPAPARYFWPLESRHFVSILTYLIQFLSLCSFVDCDFRVSVSSMVRCPDKRPREKCPSTPDKTPWTCPPDRCPLGQVPSRTNAPLPT